MIQSNIGSLVCLNLNCGLLPIICICILNIDWFVITSCLRMELLVTLKKLWSTTLARFLTCWFLSNVQLLEINIWVYSFDRHPFHRSIGRIRFLLLRFWPYIRLLLNTCLTFLRLMTRLNLVDYLYRLLWSIFSCFLCLCSFSLFSFSLYSIQSSVHVVVFEMSSSFRTLVFLTRVIVKVDALVVKEFEGCIVLLALCILPSVVVLLSCLLIYVWAVLEVAVLHLYRAVILIK